MQLPQNLLDILRDKRVSLFIIGVGSLFVLVSVAIIFFSSLYFSRQQVNEIITRMQEDIRYKDGFWDLYYLDSDPLLPGSNPHYILTTDGYAIERWRPIDGFLDTSNIEYILQFETPQTITTPTREQWRVWSAPVKDNTETIGAIFVSRFIAEGDNMEIIDKRLAADMTFVQDKLKISNGTIDSSNLDIRETQYDISIKIVDKFNNVLAKTNNSNSKDRAPNYIDTSYVFDVLNSNEQKFVRNTTTGEPYLTISSPVKDQNNETVGVIIVGTSLLYLFTLMQNYLLGITILALVVLIILWLMYQKKHHAVQNYQMYFDPTDGIIHIDKAKIELPLDSHQYHLAVCLFKNPTKPCTAEDVGKEFNEVDGNLWRRVYDAMLIVNKKVEPYTGEKLCVIRNKHFMINPRVIDNLRS